MRIIDRSGNTLNEYDLELGYLSPSMVIREGAKPIDDIEKFAWDDDDYEEVMIYELFPKEDTTAPLTYNEKMRLFIESIEEDEYPVEPPADGYKYKRKYSHDKGRFVWEQEKRKGGKH